MYFVSSNMISHNNEYGFTLLELILVLFILAILTTTSLSFIENEDGQFRYDESINKIDFVIDSLLKERFHKGNEFYTGFIYDNGTIPPDSETDLVPLTSEDEDWSDNGSDTWLADGIILPFYDFTSGSPAPQQLADEARFDLRKGFRGNYLTQGLDSSSNFRDAWNENYTITPDNNNHQYDITFDGTNKADFNDRTISLEDIEWSISPTELDIRITNNSGGTITDYEVGVLIFVNDSVANAQDRWQTFHFNISSLADTSILESTSAAWNVDGTTLDTERIPVGEHLVILVDNSITADGESEIIDSQQFLVFQNSNQPEINLEIP